LRAFNEFSQEYIFYCLEHKDVGPFIKGGTRAKLNQKELREIVIPAPPKLHQAKIAYILKTVDTLISQTHSLIAKYNAIKQGMMQDLFTRGIDEHGNLRPTYQESPRLYRNTPTGPVPNSWLIKSLGTICTWSSGGTPNKSNAAFWNGTIPWISPKDMKVFEISEGQDFITDEAAHFGSKIVGPGTVLIVVRGMILAHSFPVAITTRNVAFNQDMKALVCDGQVKGRFLAHWLVAHSSKILSKTTEATHGTKRFDLSELYKIPFPVPTNGEQEKIIQLLDNLDAVHLTERNNHHKLQLIKNGLMQDLLTGKVRVKVDESTESERDVGVHQS
jgi:type I restriction enzyme, S subunit